MGPLSFFAYAAISAFCCGINVALEEWGWAFASAGMFAFCSGCLVGTLRRLACARAEGR